MLVKREARPKKTSPDEIRSFARNAKPRARLINRQSRTLVRRDGLNQRLAEKLPISEKKASPLLKQGVVPQPERASRSENASTRPGQRPASHRVILRQPNGFHSSQSATELTGCLSCHQSIETSRNGMHEPPNNADGTASLMRNVLAGTQEEVR